MTCGLTFAGAAAIAVPKVAASASTEMAAEQAYFFMVKIFR